MLIFLVFAKPNSRRPPLSRPSPYLPTSLPHYLLLDHRLPRPCRGDAKPVTVSGYLMRIAILSERSESKDLSYNRKCGYYRHAICHREEKRVTVSPLESALTDCDAHKFFRIRSYEKCRVSPTFSCSFFFHQSLSPLPSLSPPLSFHALMNCKFCNSFVFT